MNLEKEVKELKEQIDGLKEEISSLKKESHVPSGGGKKEKKQSEYTNFSKKRHKELKTIKINKLKLITYK